MKIQKTITLDGKKYTGKQIIARTKGYEGVFHPCFFTTSNNEYYVTPRKFKSETDTWPGAMCEPENAEYVEVGYPDDNPKILVI